MTHIHESRVLFSPQTIKKKKKNSGQFIFLCLFRFYMGLFELKIMLGKNRSVLEFGNLNNKHSAFYLFYNF